MEVRWAEDSGGCDGGGGERGAEVGEGGGAGDAAGGGSEEGEVGGDWGGRREGSREEGGMRYFLRWETLPLNSDRPRPPPWPEAVPLEVTSPRYHPNTIWPSINHLSF